jgi:hypothetical protein
MLKSHISFDEFTVRLITVVESTLNHRKQEVMLPRPSLLYRNIRFNSCEVEALSYVINTTYLQKPVCGTFVQPTRLS